MNCIFPVKKSTWKYTALWKQDVKSIGSIKSCIGQDKVYPRSRLNRNETIPPFCLLFGSLSQIQRGEKIIHIACILMNCYRPIIFPPGCQQKWSCISANVANNLQGGLSVAPVCQCDGVSCLRQGALNKSLETNRPPPHFCSTLLNYTSSCFNVQLVFLFYTQET